MSPRIKICNKIRDFLPLDVLLPLSLHGILGEDREHKIRAIENKQLGVTDFNTEKTICHLHSAYLIQLYSMILVLYQHHIRLAALLCDSRTKPICNKNPEEPFLEIEVKGEREITSKLKSFLQGERILRGECKKPQMLGVQEERSYMSLIDERHVHS